MVAPSVIFTSLGVLEYRMAIVCCRPAQFTLTPPKELLGTCAPRFDYFRVNARIGSPVQ